MRNKPYWIKIITGIFLSYLISVFLLKEIFIADSPRIRQDVGSYLAKRITGFFSSRYNFVASLFYTNKDPKKELENIPFQNIAKGIYAKSKGNMSYTYVKLNEVEWVEYRFYIKGKEIKIHVPKEQIPPSQEELNKLF